MLQPFRKVYVHTLPSCTPCTPDGEAPGEKHVFLLALIQGGGLCSKLLQAVSLCSLGFGCENSFCFQKENFVSC